MTIHRGSTATIALVLVFLCAVVVGAASRNADFPIGTYQNDPFTITFQEDGMYRVLHSSGAGVTGTYKISGDRIELSDTGGEFACQESVGRYAWKVDGDKLIFTLVGDECDGRMHALTSAPLVRRAGK